MQQEEWLPDEVIGLHPLGDDAGSTAVEGNGSDPMGLHISWQLQQQPDQQPVRHLMVQSGQLAYTHTPGFAANVGRFIGLTNASHLEVPSVVLGHSQQHESSKLADSASSSPLAQPSSAASSAAVSSKQQVTGLLSARLAVSVSAGALQLAVLSRTRQDAAALVLSVDGLSARLGAVKAAGRPESLTASLLSLHRCGWPLPCLMRCPALPF